MMSGSNIQDIVLELFVQGQSVHSVAALERVRRICDSEFKQGYTLEVVDIHQSPARAARSGVVATPTLVRLFPEPVLRTVGRLNEQRVRQGLGIDE